MISRLRALRFRWDRYYPWYFLADLAIMGVILAAIIWCIWG